MESTRNIAIDISKGIAIILMVFGHLNHYFQTGSNYNDIVKLIYVFHMPFFFIMAGINLKISNNLVKKKISRIIFPWFIATVMYSILYSILLGAENNPINFFKIVLSGLFTDGNFDGSWFLPCLFLSQFLITIIFHLLKQQIKLFLFSMCLLGIIGLFFANIFTPFQLQSFSKIYGLNVVLVSSMLISLGYFLKNMRYENTKLAVFSTLLVAVSFSYNSMVDIHYSQYGNKFLFLFGSLSGSYLLLFISKKLEKLQFAKPLAFIGKHSMSVLLFHSFSLLIIRAMFNPITLSVLSAFLYTIGAVIVPVLCTIFINRTNQAIGFSKPRSI